MNAPVPTLTERARKIVAEILGIEPAKVVPEALLWDDLGADSLDRYELSMVVEEEFDVEATDDEIDALQTFGDLVALLEKKCAWPTTG